MPWKTLSGLLERERFVLAALRRHRRALKKLCGEFGISRKTAYKWLARYRACGRAGLVNRARAPKRRPRQKPAKWKQRVGEVRRARPHWGAKKIHRRLRELYPRVRLPVVRTLGRWLVELGLVGPRPRRARRGPLLAHPGLTRGVRLHQVWTVDFKGWFRTGNGQRQEPLSVREASRRYLLEIRLLGEQSDKAARRAMTRLFRREGLPQIIRVDNGAPFGGKGALGLSRLSVVVGAFGHSGRVHPPGAPRRQRGARADACALSGGGGGRAGGGSSRPATAERSLALRLQSAPPARSARATNSRPRLSSQCALFSSPAAAFALPGELAGAPSAPARRNQVAGPAALCRTCFCGRNPRPQANRAGILRGLSRHAFDRGTLGCGSRRDAARPLATPPIPTAPTLT